ncbi:MAG: CoA transferase [Propionibacteriaceae bacterium]|jgi:crotonobetainyl-CoA:carnitine CoA-transferase CaiB-like acyl-CoA transferase|nr:CoA transferase [Propionibacteriaceae bacterium]
MQENLITERFGPLQGVRVLLTGVAFAGPFAARWLGDWGAEIIKVEIPEAGDTSRIGKRVEGGVVPKWISLGRNMNSFEFSMNFTKNPESKEVFMDLIKQCDIWINSVPNIGKHGATDELCLELNPKLVIVHITGYGLPQNGGEERLLGRPCVDPVAQAFSGLAAMQGMPDGPYLTANPIGADIVSAHQAAAAALAGYISAERTGKGQVIDLAMYESAAYFQSYHWCSQLNGEGLYKRTGPLNPTWYPFGYYECGDGRSVAVGVWGLNVWKKFTNLMGVTEEDFPYMAVCGQDDKEKVQTMDLIWKKYLADHTAKEVESEFLELGIPVSMINNANDAFEHPHWQARHDFITYQDVTTGRDFYDIATAPKFMGTPCDTYKGGPLLGQETDQVLKDILGYDDAKVAALKQAGAVAASLTTK